MLTFEMNKKEIHCLDEVIADYPDNVIITHSRDFSGGMDITEVIIILTPTILSSVTLLMNNILQHKISESVDLIIYM
jgi:hypothetical protein